MESLLLIDSSEPTKEDLILLFDQRDLLTGKTPFTSMLALDGRVAFLEKHLERLKASFEFMYPEKEFESLKLKIKKGLERISKLEGRYYIRLTMLESETDVTLIIQIRRYPDTKFENIKLQTTEHPQMLSKLPSFLKFGNYLESSLQVKKAAAENFQDCLFLDKKGLCKECSTSNIFFRKGERFFTPALEGAVLDGITRKVVIEILQELGLTHQERGIDRDEWQNMDEVFITNSLKGLVTVSQIDARTFETNSDYFKKINRIYKNRMITK